MTHLENYTGPPLGDLALQTRAALEAAGFQVEALPGTNSKKTRNLIRICWRGVYVGQMTSELWNSGFGCLYRFGPIDGIKGFRFAEPPHYGERDFMALHELQEQEFSRRQDGKLGGRYYRIRGIAATLKVMRQTAYAVDKLLGIAGDEARTEQLTEDFKEIARRDLSTTERDALFRARLGQGKF